MLIREFSGPGVRPDRRTDTGPDRGVTRLPGFSLLKIKRMPLVRDLVLWNVGCQGIMCSHVFVAKASRRENYISRVE